MLSKKIKFIFLVTLIIVLFATLKFEVVVPGEGIIVGGIGDIDIITPDSGFVNLVNVKEGGSINKGEIIFSYNNLDIFYREKSLTNLKCTHYYSIVSINALSPRIGVTGSTLKIFK